MHGRIVSAKVRAGMLDEAVRIYRESVVPAAQQQQGFRGALLFMDSQENNGVSITLWETEDDLLRGQSSGYYQQQIGKFANLLEGSPQQQGYELSVSVQVQV